MPQYWVGIVVNVIADDEDDAANIAGTLSDKLAIQDNVVDARWNNNLPEEDNT